MAQTRYRTLLSHLAQVFQAGDAERTGRLQAGLDDIVAKIDPQDAKTWQLVKDDSERLLRVWVMREERALMDQILGALSDYATAEKEELPKLVITTMPLPRDALTPLEYASTPKCSFPPVVSAAPAHIVESKDSKVDDEAEAEEEAEEEAEAEAEADEEVEVEVEAEAEAEEEADVEAEAEVEEVEVEEEAEVEIEAEAEEEAEEAEEAADEDAAGSVVEPAEEEEAEDEEEGMEVDKVVIRGRSYWMDTKTKKLYAIVGDDDVGDEVGAIVNGKAVFVG